MLAIGALLPPLWAAFPRIYGVAGLLLAMGLAAWLVPAIERRSEWFRMVVRRSFPGALCLFLFVAASCWATARMRERVAWPVQAHGAPNILLIVLDTVGASHLSLFGYNRPTSPTMEELASRGISFTRAPPVRGLYRLMQASLLDVGLTSFPPAGSRRSTGRTRLSPSTWETNGYSTAGFAATFPTALRTRDSHAVSRLIATMTSPRSPGLHVAVIVSRLVDGLQKLESFCTDTLQLPFLKVPADLTWQLLAQERKDAAAIRREFLDWLSARDGEDRPFFAFLNFYDAHHPYQLPPTGIHRFGSPWRRP